jgi:hypothetical protein
MEAAYFYVHLQQSWMGLGVTMFYADVVVFVPLNWHSME